MHSLYTGLAVRHRVRHVWAPVLALALMACGRTNLDTLFDEPQHDASAPIDQDGAPPSVDASREDASASIPDATIDSGSDAGSDARDAGVDSGIDAPFDACVPPPAPDAAFVDPGPRPPWATNLKGEINALARDSQGNIFGVGMTQSSDQFYMAKLDASGATLWQKTLGDSFVFANDVAVDGADNVIVVGYTGNGTLIDFGGGPSLPGSFIVKYSPTGAFISQTTFPIAPTSSLGITGVRILSSGDMIIAGGLSGTVSFGATKLTAHGSNDVFVARYDVCGALVFAKVFGNDHASANALVVDASDNLFVSGTFTGLLDFGGPSLNGGAADWQTFVAKLDPSGAFIASRQFDVVGDSGSGRGSVDASGDLVLPGYYDGSIDFGSGPLVTTGGRDIYVTKLSPMLDVVWSETFGGIDHQAAIVASCDQSDNVIVSGTIAGEAHFGAAGTLVAPANDDLLFLAKLSHAGDVLSARLASGGASAGSASSRGTSVLIAGNGDAIVGGGYFGAFSFGAASFAAYSGEGVVMRVAP